jgi:hypothetical protein
MPSDHREKNPSRTVGPSSALLPIPQRAGLKPKFRRERRLTQSKLSSYGTDINHWHFHPGNTNRNIVPFRPIHCFPEAFENATYTVSIYANSARAHSVEAYSTLEWFLPSVYAIRASAIHFLTKKDLEF